MATQVNKESIHLVASNNSSNTDDGNQIAFGLHQTFRFGLFASNHATGLHRRHPNLREINEYKWTHTPESAGRESGEG